MWGHADAVLKRGWSVSMLGGMESPYTQAVVVLTAQAPDIGVVNGLLAPLCPDYAAKGSPGGGWINGFPSWRVPINGHPTGRAEILAASDPYPRDLGESSCNEMTEACFEAGCMGPHALPAHAINMGALPVHRGVIVVRTSYAFGTGTAAAQASPNPLLDLVFVTTVAARLLKGLPGSAYFSPASGVLLKGEEFLSIAGKFKGIDTPPLPLWVRCRVTTSSPQSPHLSMDLVGLAQLGLEDQEAVYARGAPGVEQTQVARMLMTIGAAGLRGREPGPTVRPGPGGLWRAERCEEAAVPPVRPVVRWALEQSV